jgi:hypothetical protein
MPEHHPQRELAPSAVSRTEHRAKLQNYRTAHSRLCLSICFGDMYWIVPTVSPSRQRARRARVKR